MFVTLLNRIIDGKPQWVRELKGRLKTRNIVLVSGVSLLFQFLLLLFFYIQLPSGEYIPVNRYAIAVENSKLIDTNWQIWWLDIFRILNWLIPLVLILAGIYMLIQDLATEDRRGTLNFIRLSPQSSYSILIGKILGVPSLLYLGIALVLPLHIFSALSAGIYFNFLLLLYGFLATICAFFYSAALLLPLLEVSQAWVGSLLASLFVVPLLSLIYFFVDVSLNIGIGWDTLYTASFSKFSWFYFPICKSFGLTYLFTLASIFLLTFCIWKAINRRFHNPIFTVISKRQSYAMFGGLQIWILGFILPNLNSENAEFYAGFGLIYLYVIIPLLFLVLMTALSHQRQTLQDWARYRRSHVKTKTGFWNRNLLQDLILAEKSPSMGAIMINSLLIFLFWSPWILIVLRQNPYFEKGQDILAILGLLMTLNFILICATLTQLTLLIKVKKPQIQASSMLTAIIGLPPALLSILSMSPEQNPAAWLFSSFPFAAIFYAPTPTILMSILGQFTIIGLLNLQLTRQLKKAGESNSKALLSGYSA